MARVKVNDCRYAFLDGITLGIAVQAGKLVKSETNGVPRNAALVPAVGKIPVIIYRHLFFARNPVLPN